MGDNNLHDSKLGNGHLPASETVRHAAEVLRQSIQEAQHNSPTTSHGLREGAAAVIETQRHLTEQPFEALSNAALGGLHNFQQSMAGFVEGVVRMNLRAAEGLLQCANPGVYVEMQQRFIRDYLDVLNEGYASLVGGTPEPQAEPSHQVRQHQRAAA